MVHVEHLTCPDNITNSTLDHGSDSGIAELPKVVAGCLVFFVVLPFVLFEFSFFPIGVTAGVLLGAFLMVLCQVISQDEVYEVLGHQEHLTTIFLLLGMMLLAEYFEREKLLDKLLHKLLKKEHTFANYIWRVCLIAFALSAFFTNDACCAILTPILLSFWEDQERPRSEIETILLAIATSANIGSVTTIFGNPLMALIAAKTSSQLYHHSMLDLRTCLMYLGPPALLALGINIGFLLLHHKVVKRRLRKYEDDDETSIHEEEIPAILISKPDELLEKSNKKLQTLSESLEEEDFVAHKLGTITEDDSSENSDEEIAALPKKVSFDANTTKKLGFESGDKDDGPQRSKPRRLRFSNASIDSTDSNENFGRRLTRFRRPSHIAGPSGGSGMFRRVSGFSAVDFLPTDAGGVGFPFHQLSIPTTPMTSRNSIIFKVVLSVLTLMVVVLFLASNNEVKFDMGLVPMAAAISVVTFDALLNRHDALVIMKRVDWSILMMFFGIFIWMDGLIKTRVPHFLWGKMGLTGMTTMPPTKILIFCLFVLFGTNIVSNVPLTIIVLEQLEPCKNQLTLVIYLAWTAIIAGNLTLFGSVANLVVAQKGMQTLNFRLGFVDFLKYGLPSTIVNVIVGIVVIYGLLQL